MGTMIEYGLYVPIILVAVGLICLALLCVVTTVGHAVGQGWANGLRASEDARMSEQAKEWAEWVGQPVAFSARLRPEVYFGTLMSVSDSHVRIATEYGVDIRFYVRPSEVLAFGPYDADKMKAARTSEALTQFLHMGGGGHAAH